MYNNKSQQIIVPHFVYLLLIMIFIFSSIMQINKAMFVVYQLGDSPPSAVQVPTSQNTVCSNFIDG
jgi:hypothetical protein